MKNQVGIIYDIDSSIEMISNYVYDKFLSEEEFCLAQEIHLKSLRQMVHIVSRYDKELYHSYLLKVILSEVFEKIKYGVYEEDQMRSFNILDYYILLNEYMLPGLTPDELFKSVSFPFINGDETLVRKFIDLSKEEPIKEQTIMKTKLIISQVEITDLEKLAIINYLKEIKAPLGNRLFLLTARSYRQGKYTLKSQKLIKTIKSN